MESTQISTGNGNLAEYFVSYSGEENNELIMQTGSTSSEGCDQSGNIYISTPPDIRVEHVSVDKDGNLILQTTSSKSDIKACDQPEGIAPNQVTQPFYTSLPSTSQALPSQNTFITYKDGVVGENKQLLLAENSTINSDQKIFFLQPNAAENVNLVLANALNNNAELTALRQANDNIVLNIVTEDGQKLENVILTQNVGEPIRVKPKPNLDIFPSPDSLGRNSQQMLKSYSKPVTPEKTRGYSGRRKSGRGRGRGAYASQPVLREFHMEKKLAMLPNFQELVKTSQSKIKPSTAKLSANCSRPETVRAVNTDQNTIILTRSQPQQSLLQHPKTANPITETLPSTVARPPKTPTAPKLVTTPVIMKTSELKGVSHKGLQQLASMKGASTPQVSTSMSPTAKAEPAKKASNQMSTIVVIVPPSSKWGTSAADIDAKEKPLLENPSIMFSQNSSSSRTMLYEIPAKIVKFQEDKPLQRKLPFRHQDYLKVTKIQNEGEPIRPPGRFYKSRGSKKSVQISIPVVEKLADEKGTKIVNSAQQLMSMYPLLSTRLPQIAKVVDSSNMSIPQSVLGTEAEKSEPTTSQDHSSTAMTPECSLSSNPKLDLQVSDTKTNIVSKDVQCIDKQLKGNTAAQTTDNAPSFCHSNVLRTYQELRSISQKGRSCSPAKMGTKNLKQNCHTSSAQTCTTGVSDIVVAEADSKATNIEISQAVLVERPDNLQKMKSVTLESVLKRLDIASPDDSIRPAVTSCTFKSDVTEEQHYCHEKLLGTVSHKESASICSESVLPDPYLNKQHCPEATATSSTQNTDGNLIDSAQHKTDDHTLKKENDLLPHSQNEKNTENSIQHDQSSVNIDSLLTPQTSGSMKYDVQTSVARNLSAGLKTLDLDSFLALSTDDDEVGRDGSLVSKEVSQEPISKQEQLPVDHSSSKNGTVCRLSEQFPEGVLYIEEPSSSASSVDNLTEDTGDSNTQRINSEGGIVPATDNVQSSACQQETKSVSTISSENYIGLDCQTLQTASMESTPKLKLLSYGNVQESDLQMQDMSKDNNLGNMKLSELATKSSEVLDQIEVSGGNIEAIDKPEKSSTSTMSDNKKATVSSEDRLDEQKTIFSHDSLDISNTHHDTTLQCSDIPNVTSANIITSFNVSEINKETKGVIVDSQTGLESSSDAASFQATNTSLVSSEKKAGETDICGMLIMNNSFQQPSTNVNIENGNNYETERTVNQQNASICSSEQSFPNETFHDNGDNAVGESQLENKLQQSEISDLRSTSDMEAPQSSSDNANITSSEDGINELAEEKLQNTSSLKNKILSEMHFTKAGNSGLLDEVTDLQKEPGLLRAMLTCSGDETGIEIAEIATGLNKTPNNTITLAEQSSFNNGTSLNLEVPSHHDKDAKSDVPLEPFVMGESYSKQDDSIRNSTTEEDIPSYSVVDNAKLDTEDKTLSSQDGKESFNTVFSAQESPELGISKTKALLSTFVPDPHTENQKNETVIGSPSSLCTSSDVDLKKTSTDNSVNQTDEVSNIAETSENTKFMFEGEKEYDNAKTETSQHSIPISSVINISTNEKLNTSNVRNGTLSCICTENYSNVAPLSPSVGIVTGLNVLASKETHPTGANLSNINFINLLQPSKKMNPSGVPNSHLLSYANTVLLLPAINAQGPSVEYLNPVRNQSEQATPDALSLGSQINNKDELYTGFNKSSASNTVNVHQSTNKSIEPLQKCEKVHYQMSGFVFAGEQALSTLKEGQMILSGQTSQDTANVSPSYVLQNRTQKVTQDPSEYAAENSLFKISDVETSSNIGLNNSNTYILEPNDKEGEIAIIKTVPSTSKQVGRERRRRKQSLEELRLPEEFMKMEVLPLQEESPVKKKRRYRKRRRTLAVDVKKELESSDYCGDAIDAKLKKDESKEIDKNGLLTAKNSQCVNNSNLSINIQKITDSGKSFSDEGSGITKLKQSSEEPLLISDKTGKNVKEMNGQKLATGETVIAHPQKLSLGQRDEDNGAGMKEGLSPKTTKLVKVDAKKRSTNPKRRLFKQLSSENLLKKDEKKSKRILSKANSLDQELLNTSIAICDLVFDQHNSGEPSGPGSSSIFTVNQSTKKSRENHKEQTVEKIESMENENQKTCNKTVKSSSAQLEQVVQSVPDSKNKKDVPETLPQRQLSKLKVNSLKNSLRYISRRTSLKHKLIKKNDSPETSSKNVTALGKSSPVQKKEQRTATIIRELRKRMTPHYRKQESSYSVSKKQTLKTNSKKAKTNKDNSSLLATESQGKERSEQDKKNLRRSARQYIKKKIVKIRMSLKLKPQGSDSDTASLSTRKRNCSAEKGTDSMSNQKQKTNDKKKCLDKITKSKSDKRKKFSTFGRRGLQMQRSNSPEYPIAIPMPQNACSEEDCVQKEDQDAQTRALDDKTVDEEANIVDDSKLNPISTDLTKVCLQNECAAKPEEANIVDDSKLNPVNTDLTKECLQNECAAKPEEANIVDYSKLNPVSTDLTKVCLQNECAAKPEEANIVDDSKLNPVNTDLRKECLQNECAAKSEEANVIDDSKLNPVNTDIRKESLQNECAAKADVTSLENSTEVKISSEEKAPSTVEETNSLRAVTDKKVGISLKADKITEGSEISRHTADIDVKDCNVISADIEEIRMENENIKMVTNISDIETNDTSKLDDIISSDIEVDKEVPFINRDSTEAASSAEMSKPVDSETEGEKLKRKQLPSVVSELTKADKEMKPEVPKKKFFKHREPGQMRNKRFTCIFNIEENEKELPELSIKTEKPDTDLLEGPFRDTEQYRMYGKRYIEMADYELTESALENVEKPLQLDSHMLDIGINLPEIPDITFIASSERKWPLAAKEMKCYVGKRRRLLDDADEEEEEEEEEQEVKQEPQEELEFQSSRWPETTRKRCYPGKRTPKFSEYHPCSFLQKRSPERSSLRSYGKSKRVDSPEGGESQFKQGSPKLLSKYAAMEDNRQQKRSIVNLSLGDEGNLERQVSTGCVRMQVEDSCSGKKEAEQRFNVPPHLLGRNIGDPASDPTERKSPLQQPRIGVRVPYRNLTSQIVSSQEIVREILERSRVRSTAIAMAMNKRVADAVDRSFSKRLNASLARLPMPSGPEELEAALQASAGTKLKLLPQDKEAKWKVGLPGVIGSSATPTVATSYTGSKSGTRSRSSTRGAQGSGLYLDKESEREIALRQLETLPSRCRSNRRQKESAVKVTKPKKLDWCKQRSRRKQSK